MTPTKLFVGSALVSSILCGATYAHATTYWLVSPQSCIAQPIDIPENYALAFYNDYEFQNNQGNNAKVDCPVPSATGFVLTSIQSVNVDVYNPTGAYQATAQACVTFHNGGGGTCGSFASGGGSGYQRITLSGSELSAYSTYSGDYPLVMVDLGFASGGFNASFNGIYIVY